MYCSCPMNNAPSIGIKKIIIIIIIKKPKTHHPNKA